MNSATDHLVRLGLRSTRRRSTWPSSVSGRRMRGGSTRRAGSRAPGSTMSWKASPHGGSSVSGEGSPLTYSAVSPEMVISHLKRDFETAAHESMKSLEGLSLDAQRDSSPIWYVQERLDDPAVPRAGGRGGRTGTRYPLLRHGNTEGVPGPRSTGSPWIGP